LGNFRAWNCAARSDLQWAQWVARYIETRST
jgi:hypothetical protein